MITTNNILSDYWRNNLSSYEFCEHHVTESHVLERYFFYIDREWPSMVPVNIHSRYHNKLRFWVPIDEIILNEYVENKWMPIVLAAINDDIEL